MKLLTFLMIFGFQATSWGQHIEGYSVAIDGLDKKHHLDWVFNNEDQTGHFEACRQGQCQIINGTLAVREVPEFLNYFYQQTLDRNQRGPLRSALTRYTRGLHLLGGVAGVTSLAGLIAYVRQATVTLPAQRNVILAQAATSAALVISLAAFESYYGKVESSSAYDLAKNLEQIRVDGFDPDKPLQLAPRTYRFLIHSLKNGLKEFHNKMEAQKRPIRDDRTGRKPSRNLE